MRGVLAAALSGVLGGPALGQASQPATTPAVRWELSADVRAALDEIDDFTVGFDRPGFYAVVQHVKRSIRSPGHFQAPIVIEDWRELAERPNSFRGCPVTIEGLVGRSKDPYTLPRHPHLGQLWQLELYQPNQPLACTLILTADASDVPVGASIRATGYFIMIRKYPDRAGREQFAALLIAPAPTEISSAAQHADSVRQHWWWLIAALALGLLVTLILLRRSGGGVRRDVRTLQSTRSAPMSLADDLSDWADESDNGQRRGNGL